MAASVNTQVTVVATASPFSNPSSAAQAVQTAPTTLTPAARDRNAINLSFAPASGLGLLARGAASVLLTVQANLKPSSIQPHGGGGSAFSFTGVKGGGSAHAAVSAQSFAKASALFSSASALQAQAPGRVSLSI